MGICYITRREQREEVSEQLGVYCAGNDARPFGEVEIPSKVITLATRVFQNDEYVTKINLPPLLQEIQERAFENCIELQEIIFPDTLQTINEYAFEGCTKLIEIAVPDNIPLLKPYTFGGNNINQLVLKSSFSPKLWDYAYADNHSIKSVDVNCHAISKGCFSGSDIETVIIEGNTKILKERAFENCKKLINLQLNSDLLEIGDYCFYNTNLSKITIPKTIQRIGIYCFGVNNEKLPGLKEVTFQDGLKVISQYSFYGTALESVFIPKTIESIGKYAFGECNSLLEIQLEPGIQQLGIFEGYAFAKSGIEKIFIPSSVQKITKDCFNSCTKLRTAEFETPIPKGKLEEGIFRYCSSLNEVILPEDTLYLGQNMFEGCTSLESITLPKNLEELDNYCFKGCTNLKTLDIPESIKRIGKYCFQDTYISKVKLPKTLTEIEGYAFSGCDNLGTIEFDYFDSIKEIPTTQGLRIIRANAFANSKVENLNIPYTIQTIERDAFRGMNVDTLHIDVIKTQDWLDASKTWGMSYKTLKWRQSILRFDSNEEFFELFVSQDNSPTHIKVDTSKSEYVFEPYDKGITLYYWAYAPNKAPIEDFQFFNRTERENERSFIFEEQAPFKIEFVIKDGNAIIDDAQVTADTLFKDFRYTYNTPIFYVNKNTDIIQYKVLRSGYGIVYGKLYNIEKNETIEIQLSKNGYSYIELSYPFNEHQEYLSNILDGKHYRKSLMIGIDAYANTLQSINTKVGTKESSINAAYVKFRTPADLYSENTITIKFIIADTGYDSQNFKAVLGPSPYYKDCEESWTYPSPSQSGGQNFIGLGEECLDDYMNSTEVRTIQKQVNNLKPNTDYYISFAHDFRNLDWSYDPERTYYKIFIKSISFYSCPIAISTEYPEYISSKNDICLYDGIGKTEAYINTEFFDTIESKLIFEKVSTLTGNNLYFWYRSNSNCCGNILDKSYSISHSTGGYTDASIFKLKQSIDLTNYAKIKITCLLFHDYSNTMTVGSYCRLTNNAEDIVIPTAASSLDTAISYDWGDWNQIYAGQIPTGAERFATITLDVSKLEGVYELYFGTYHGIETSGYTAYNGVVEVELYTKEEEIINEIETESTIIE